MWRVGRESLAIQARNQVMMHNIRDGLKLLLPFSLRRTILKVRFAYRKPISVYRMVPDFLILGAMRAGTSSLFRYLAMHPSTSPSLRKETRYFSGAYGKGERWYRSHFPTRFSVQLFSQVRSSKLLTFEASPDYLFHPHAAQRAVALVPNARLIVLLRNPVDRAVSHYQHMVRLGHETRRFEEALDEEPMLLEAERAKLMADPAYLGDAFRRFSYFARGLYAEQLENWFQYYPRNRFLIISSEEFFRYPGKAYKQILGFLELPYWEPAEFRNYSYWGAGEGVAVPNPIADSTREELAIRYRIPNQQLFQLVNRDFDWDHAGSLSHSDNPSHRQNWPKGDSPSAD